MRSVIRQCTYKGLNLRLGWVNTQSGSILKWKNKGKHRSLIEQALAMLCTQLRLKVLFQNCQISNIFLEVLKSVCLNCLEETDIGKILTWFDWASDWGTQSPQSEASGYATPWIGGPYIFDIKYFKIITITSFVVLNFSNKNIIHVARTGIELCLKHDFKPNYSAPIDDQNPQHYVGKILTWSLFFFFFFVFVFVCLFVCFFFFEIWQLFGQYDNVSKQRRQFWVAYKTCSILIWGAVSP